MIKYGEEVKTTFLEGVVNERVHKFVDFENVKEFLRQTETIKVRDDKHILAQWLKLMDRQTAGEITNISIECVPDVKTGRIIRVKMSWICIEPLA